jgi:tetratricopeptide (TPR) repeat protein
MSAPNSQIAATQLWTTYGKPTAVMNRLRLCLVFCLWLAHGGISLAQIMFFPSAAMIPQAKSPEELDAYGLIFECQDPKETVTLAKGFLGDYPESEFRQYVLVQQMHSYEMLDDYERVIETGKQALTVSSRNVDVLITLAAAIGDRVPVNGPQREALLAEAERYATQARDLLKGMKRSHSVPRKQFAQYIRQTRAENAAAFGLIALQRHDLNRAIEEYVEATTHRPNPRGIDHYRLGIAYFLNRQNDKAFEHLQHAVSLGPLLISTLAQKQIDSLRSSSQK